VVADTVMAHIKKTGSKQPPDSGGRAGSLRELDEEQRIEELSVDS
jgi:hypothetical protein